MCRLEKKLRLRKIVPHCLLIVALEERQGVRVRFLTKDRDEAEVVLSSGQVEVQNEVSKALHLD